MGVGSPPQVTARWATWRRDMLIYAEGTDVLRSAKRKSTMRDYSTGRRVEGGRICALGGTSASATAQADASRRTIGWFDGCLRLPR